MKYVFLCKETVPHFEMMHPQEYSRFQENLFPFSVLRNLPVMTYAYVTAIGPLFLAVDSKDILLPVKCS